MRALNGHASNRRTSNIGRLICAVTLTAGVVVVRGPAVGAVVGTLYVDKANPACSDTGSGTAAVPYCTITKAAKIADAGQTVQVAAGTYAENVVPYKSGTAALPIVYRPAPGAAVTLTGGTRSFYISKLSYIEITGFSTTTTSSSGVYLVTSDHITVSGNHITYAGTPSSGLTARGVYVSGSTDCVIRNNEIDHNSDSAIYLTGNSTRVLVTANNLHDNAREYQRAANGVDVRSPGNSIIGNWAHDNEDSGIQMYTGGDNTLVANNVSNHNRRTSSIIGPTGDHGIDNLGVSGSVIVGNTVYDNVTAGINLEGNSIGGSVFNNITVDNGINSPRTTSNVRFDSTSTTGASEDFGLVNLTGGSTQFIWGSGWYTTVAAFNTATGQQAHGLMGNPLFVNASGGNFHLGATSPAIDSASSGATGAQAIDIENIARTDVAAVANTGSGPRAYDDRGAYEYH